MFYAGGPLPISMMYVLVMVGSLSPISMMYVLVMVGSLSAVVTIGFAVYLHFQHKRQKDTARKRHKMGKSPRVKRSAQKSNRVGR